MTEPPYPVPPPELQPYVMELLETYLFPENFRKVIMEKIAFDYGFSFDRVLDDFGQFKELGEFNRINWMRMVEPSTEKQVHEMTAIIARVRVGDVSIRVEKFLGAYMVAAIAGGDVACIEEIKRLTGVPFQNKAWNKAHLAYHDFFKIHARAPKNAELKHFIENSLDQNRYALVDTNNWSRMVRLAGLSNIFQLASEDEERGDSPSESE